MGISNHGVATRWVGHNTGRSGNHRDYANGSSMKFQGPCIYSYRTVIGRWYGDYVLLRLNSWGVTTARHINIAGNAAYPHLPIFHVPSIGFGEEIDHKENVKHLERNLRADQQRTIRNFKNYGGGDIPYWESDHLKRTYGELAHYCELTHTPKQVEELEYILSYITTQRREKWAVYHQPKAVARRERAKARHDAKIALGVN